MIKKEKLLNKFLNNPKSLKYSEIEKLFDTKRFKIEEKKGSHKKISLIEDETKYVVSALHNNDCLDVYKVMLKKFYILTH